MFYSPFNTNYLAHKKTFYCLIYIFRKLNLTINLLPNFKPKYPTLILYSQIAPLYFGNINQLQLIISLKTFFFTEFLVVFTPAGTNYMCIITVAVFLCHQNIFISIIQEKCVQKLKYLCVYTKARKLCPNFKYIYNISFWQEYYFN